MQILAGPRQVGKTTLVGQVLNDISIPYTLEVADAVNPKDSDWIHRVWESARATMQIRKEQERLLVIDEVQKIDNWSEVVKREWDEDSRRRVNLKVVLLGSSRLLLKRGMTESLAGRFELIRLGHWSLQEMRDAFGVTLDQYIYFGGYPGPAGMIDNEKRWRKYIKDSLVAPAIGTVASSVGAFVEWATILQPFWMGILVSVVIGIALTLPISSAAICAALGLTGLAGGAAVAGCCAQMVGFAVLSFRENRWGGLVSQGLGTSMLQMGNIVKNPKIWIPATAASAITGPIATCLFQFQMNDPAGGVASGMGTCGMVGPIGVYAGWVNDVATGMKAGITGMDWLAMLLICLVLPAVLTWLIGIPCRKMGWIREGDLKLD